jgi:hypothetical protein
MLSETASFTNRSICFFSFVEVERGTNQDHKNRETTPREVEGKEKRRK